MELLLPSEVSGEEDKVYINLTRAEISIDCDENYPPETREIVTIFFGKLSISGTREEMTHLKSQLDKLL